TWAMMAILRISRDMGTALLCEKGAHSSTRDAGILHETEKAFHHEELRGNKSHFLAGRLSMHARKFFVIFVVKTDR
ncbi:MAG: hypothetical protein Q8O58_00960, partial [Gallionella sp.]|nr:hypothetical protein [Gallionella sp.]